MQDEKHQAAVASCHDKEPSQDTRRNDEANLSLEGELLRLNPFQDEELYLFQDDDDDDMHINPSDNEDLELGLTLEKNGVLIQEHEQMLVEQSEPTPDHVLILSDDDAEMVDDDDDEVQLVTIVKKSRSCFARPLVSEAEVVEECTNGDAAKSVRVQTGIIKEFICSTSLGILFSFETGLVLFNTADIITQDCSSRHFGVGAKVNFVEKLNKESENESLSSEGILRQATAIWHGPRPKYLSRRYFDASHLQHLEEDRKLFVDLQTIGQFVHIDLARYRGTVVGYLDASFGIIKIKDPDTGDDKLAAFASTDIYSFGRPYHVHGTDVFKDIPVGLRVSIDATKIELASCHRIEYLACAVFAGPWPTTPHPTLLPGGPGSFSTSYDVPTDHTFFYLQPELRGHLIEKQNVLMSLIRDIGHDVFRRFERVFVNTGWEIRTAGDYMRWRSTVAPERFRYFGKTRDRNFNGRMKNLHLFSANAPRGGTLGRPYEVKHEAYNIKTEIKSEA